LVAKELD